MKFAAKMNQLFILESAVSKTLCELYIHTWLAHGDSTQMSRCVAGVVVSCKIPILATRVRFPGDAYIFLLEGAALD